MPLRHAERMTTQPHDDQRVPSDTFEIRLAIARAHAGGISAKEAALRVGVSGQTWRNWEDGKSSAAQKPAMLAYIAQQLGVDETWLRDGGPLAGAGTQDAPRPDGPEGESAAVVRHQGLEPRTRWFDGSAAAEPARGDLRLVA